MRERMNSIRQINKQLENKANQNWMMLRRNDIFKDHEDRMIKAESRVKELETSLAQFIEDFENLNSDLSICAQKLALAESRVELLQKKNDEYEMSNNDLLDKITKIKKPPPKTVKVNLCTHYEGSNFNPEEVMKLLETQNIQILTLTKTLDSLRRENREYFQKTLEQQETIFNLQSKIHIFENISGHGGSSFREAQPIIQTSSLVQPRHSEQQQILRMDFSASNNFRSSENQESTTKNYLNPLISDSPRAKNFSVSSSHNAEIGQKAKMFLGGLQQTFGGASLGGVSSSQDYQDGHGQTNVVNLNEVGSSTVSAVKEFSFKNTARESSDRGVKDSKNSFISVGTARLGNSNDQIKSRKSPKKI